MVMKLYIGYDAREHDGYVVCVRSLRRSASIMPYIVPLYIKELQDNGLYTRPYHIVDGQRYDEIDSRPFSTDFTYSRFLVPTLNKFDGWAVFCDLDFMFRADIMELVNVLDGRYAVMCVHHDYAPPQGLKMDGQHQAPYARKNWSSLVAFNCGHKANQALTVEKVNSAEGRWLHRFGWLNDGLIGELPLAWNYLVGHNTVYDCAWPKAVHFTEGLPSMEGYDDQEYANEWRGFLNELDYKSP